MTFVEARHMKLTLCSTSVICLSLLGACARQPSDRGGVPKVAVRMGNDVITVDELDKRIAPELFELRSQAMRAVLVDRLLQREAKQRGVDLTRLHEQEVEVKVPVPSSAEASAAVAEWVAAGQITPEEATRLTPAPAAERLRSMRIAQAEEAFYDRLMKQNAVQIDFNALGKPDLQLAANGPTLGPADAPIKIIEFADLSQPFTSMWQPTLEQLIARHGGRVQVRFKQKPSAPNSDGARLAEGALCADDQGRYWDFRRALLKDVKTKDDAGMRAAAAAAKVDVPAFERCLQTGAKKATVAQNATEAARNRLQGEPVLSINGIILSGVQDLATVERLLRIESGVL
jgi:protein-disulfide isomerase